MAIYNTNISGGLNTKDCTADASKILDGYTAGVGKEIVTGTMADNGDVSTAIVDGVLKEGYTSGGTIENLTSENVKLGIPIGGITGTYNGGFSTPLTMQFPDGIGRYESQTITVPNFTSKPLVVFSTSCGTTSDAFGAVFSYGKLVNTWYVCKTASSNEVRTFNNTTSGEARDSDYNFVVESCTSTGFTIHHTIGRGFYSVVMY